ncbi:helicase associated domain-containing protein [Streptomyces sp. NPDC058239]|uniref:helicase associated domain-containing protein n=1 Tax=Streptomyces sp. NPDC058239 TaxID=3346395 RepID=UPI0036E183B4
MKPASPTDSPPATATANATATSASPVTHTDPEGYNLGDFIAYQRALHAGTVRDRTGQSRPLLPERRAALDELGMLWTVAATGCPPTDAELAAPPHQRGNPPASTLLALVDAGVEQKALAQALGTTTSSLSQRIKRARESPSDAGPFASDLAAARAYREHHGHLRPSETSDDTNARTLGNWLTKQRRARRGGNLSDQQITALDELGMERDPLASRWQQALQAARRYHATHGHLRPRPAPSSTAPT